MGHLDDFALMIPCPSCGIEAGYWCVTFRPYHLAPGRLTTWLHAARQRPFQEAWWAGYCEGMADAVREPDWAARTVARQEAGR